MRSPPFAGGLLPRQPASHAAARGATDAEATGSARQAAQSSGITSADLGAGVPGLAFADVTGTVTAGGMGSARSCQ